MIFFPTLVNVVVGLRSAPSLACDLVRAAGGNQAMVMWKVRLPYALPAFFASARIAAPAAIGGATLAEWLATGKGLGSTLVISYSASNFNNLWSGAVLLIAVSIALYGLIGVVEWNGARVERQGLAFSVIPKGPLAVGNHSSLVLRMLPAAKTPAPALLRAREREDKGCGR